MIEFFCCGPVFLFIYFILFYLKEDEEEEDAEPSDEQTEIAKYLRFNCPTKASNYHSEKVQYFKGKMFYVSCMSSTCFREWVIYKKIG